MTRKIRRPRHYVASYWLIVLAPLFEYNHPRDAWMLRGVGRHVGPLLRPDRRARRQRRAEGSADRRRQTRLA